MLRTMKRLMALSLGTSTPEPSHLTRLTCRRGIKQRLRYRPAANASGLAVWRRSQVRLPAYDCCQARQSCAHASQGAGTDVAASESAHMAAGAGGLVATSRPPLLRHGAACPVATVPSRAKRVESFLQRALVRVASVGFGRAFCCRVSFLKPWTGSKKRGRHIFSSKRHKHTMYKR